MKNLVYLIKKHIRSNVLVYFTVILFLTIGIAAGSYTVKALPSLQKTELIEYLKGFFQILNTQDIDNHQLFLQAIKNNLKIFIPIWLLGLTFIGTPIILLLIGFRGFILGFTLGFVIDEMALKGIVFIFLSILPHNLVYIPGLIGIGVFATTFSLFILKSKIKKEKIYNRRSQIWTYTIIMLLITILLLLGSIVEGYLTPIFMKLLSSSLI